MRLRVTLAATTLLITRSAAWAARAAVGEAPTTVVVTSTPLPGLGVPIDEVAANVQVYTALDLARQHPASLADFFQQNAGSLRLAHHFELYARIDNALDRRYANFAVLARNDCNGPGHSCDGRNPPAEQFRGLGLPRAVWLGLRYGTE